MSKESIIQAYLDKGQRACMDYLIDTNQGDAQTINMQCVAMTKLEIATWCADVAERFVEQRAMA
ncbi:hypothetical protein [Lacticaseibacillus nasuensis]|uniref:hypothetical protein n=1 Tax=Lacticaseibacillus nasuensis TaxID=944671 RepID=UPI0006CFF268|nr:hypothetical protein [Lacticaseibacillus nasuensis]